MGAITIKDETQYLEGRIDTKQKNITANRKKSSHSFKLGTAQQNKKKTQY